MLWTLPLQILQTLLTLQTLQTLQTVRELAQSLLAQPGQFTEGETVPEWPSDLLKVTQLVLSEASTGLRSPSSQPGILSTPSQVLHLGE